MAGIRSRVRPLATLATFCDAYSTAFRRPRRQHMQTWTGTI